LPIQEYSTGKDNRIDTRIQLQTKYIGLNGVTGNPLTFSGTGTPGYGMFKFGEEVRQSNVRPTIYKGANSSEPYYNSSVYKFGFSSIYFPGDNGIEGNSGPAIILPGITVQAAGNNLLIFDMFFRPTSHVIGSGEDAVLFAKRPDPITGSTLNNEFALYLDKGSGLMRFSFLRTGQTGPFSNTIDIAPISSITADTWHHVMIVNRGGQFMNSYFNGNIAGTAGAVTLHPGTSNFSIGAYPMGSKPFQGYIDNFRWIIAPTGGSAGLIAYYSGNTVPVPQFQSELNSKGEVRYLIKANGIHGSTFFHVDTPSYAKAKVGVFDIDRSLQLRETIINGTFDGFTFSSSAAYIHGLSSGSAHLIAKLDSNILSLEEIKNITRNKIELQYINSLFEPLAGSSANTGDTNPFQRLFGITGDGNTYHLGFFGPTGATSQSYSVIPSHFIIGSHSHWSEAYLLNGTYSNSGSTIFLADANGSIHYFTKFDVQNLFLDLQRFVNSSNFVLGTTVLGILGATSSNDLYSKKYEKPSSGPGSPPPIFE
jgi:hypothetical protein